jgi:hypothetical protein
MKRLIFGLFLLAGATALPAQPGIIEFEVHQNAPLTAVIHTQTLSETSCRLNAEVEGGWPDYTCRWFPATGLSDPEIANPVLSINPTEKYLLEVTDSKGCSTFVEYTSSLVGIKKIESGETRLKIYVDPVSRNLSVYFPGNASYVLVSVYNIQGQLQQTASFDTVEAGSVLQASVKNLQEGVYLVNVETPANQQSEKIIIK